MGILVFNSRDKKSTVASAFFDWLPLRLSFAPTQHQVGKYWRTLCQEHVDKQHVWTVRECTTSTNWCIGQFLKWCQVQAVLVAGLTIFILVYSISCIAVRGNFTCSKCCTSANRYCSRSYIGVTCTSCHSNSTCTRS